MLYFWSTVHDTEVLASSSSLSLPLWSFFCLRDIFASFLEFKRHLQKFWWKFWWKSRREWNSRNTLKITRVFRFPWHENCLQSKIPRHADFLRISWRFPWFPCHEKNCPDICRFSRFSRSLDPLYRCTSGDRPSASVFAKKIKIKSMPVRRRPRGEKPAIIESGGNRTLEHYTWNPHCLKNININHPGNIRARGAREHVGGGGGKGGTGLLPDNVNHFENECVFIRSANLRVLPSVYLLPPSFRERVLTRAACRGVTCVRINPIDSFRRGLSPSECFEVGYRWARVKLSRKFWKKTRVW